MSRGVSRSIPKTVQALQFRLEINTTLNTLGTELGCFLRLVDRGGPVSTGSLHCGKCVQCLIEYVVVLPFGAKELRFKSRICK